MPEETSPTPRARAAWRAWLSALAVDAEAALAAALTYESLDPVARDAFLDAIDEDADAIDVPKIAIYAPFLAVENDVERKERLEKVIDSENPRHHDPQSPRRALSGHVGDEQLTVLVLPLYLNFVEVLACRWSHEHGCVSAEHEPLRAAREFHRAKIWNGVELEDTPFDTAIEELAHAVVTATRRQGRPLDALVPFADLFSLRATNASI
ncbi:MAG: hypothetical protein ABI183_14785 [Polyangiaceae bacterium]